METTCFCDPVGRLVKLALNDQPSWVQIMLRAEFCVCDLSISSVLLQVVLFFNDKSVLVPIDEDLIKLWHSVSVDSVDDAKIEEYLKRQGIQSMQDHGLKKVDPAVKRKKGAQKKARKYRRHNEHLSDVLMEFTET